MRQDARAVLAWLAAAAVSGACRHEPPVASRAPDAAARTTAVVARVAEDAAPASMQLSKPSEPAAPVRETIETPGETETLVGEVAEHDPRSETVTIKLIADPSRKARVFWGRKDLGLAPLEITRPRNSGPLDLLVLAPGYLPLHTRAFTDRDDTLSLRLFGEREAPSLLGYRREP